MKKLLIIFLLVLSITLISCSKVIEADTTTQTSIITVTSIVEVENTARIEELEKQLSQSQEENKKYQELIANLNSLLKNVYYGYASNSKWILDGFTAFSIEYKDKYYLITAGHAVEQKGYGKFGNFKFKANFSDKWIYPKLLIYKGINGSMAASDDYAIFYSDKINSGFEIGKNTGYSFILGSIEKKLNIIKNNFGEGIPGESGSPVINLNGEVIGVFTGSITYIDTILKAINNLK